MIRSPEKNYSRPRLQSRWLTQTSAPGVTASRATSGERKKEPNTSGQRLNNFNSSYINRSFVVSGNNRVIKPKCKQIT